MARRSPRCTMVSTGIELICLGLGVWGLGSGFRDGAHLPLCLFVFVARRGRKALRG